MKSIRRYICIILIGALLSVAGLFLASNKDGHSYADYSLRSVITMQPASEQTPLAASILMQLRAR